MFSRQLAAAKRRRITDVLPSSCDTNEVSMALRRYPDFGNCVLPRNIFFLQGHDHTSGHIDTYAVPRSKVLVAG